MKRVSQTSNGMTAKMLAERLAPFKTLCTKHALSSRYKTLELFPDMVRGLSSFAILEVDIKLEIDIPCAVDATLFLSVLDSLPAGSPLQLSVADGVIHWRCGQAKGKIAQATLDNPLPTIAGYEPDDGWSIPADFGTALSLGALSCMGNNTLASVGLFGVVLDNREGFSISSTDNITISYYEISLGSIEEAPQELIVLPPDGARVLGMVCDGHEGQLVFNEGDLVFFSQYSRMRCAFAAPLKKDIALVLSKFDTMEHVAEISPEAIGAFIKRVGIIAETKKNAHVNLGVSDGTVFLSFAEAIASSEESFLVDGLEDTPEIAGIDLNAEKLARALSKVEKIVLDYAEHNIVMFTGADGAFVYLVAGRSVSGD